MPLTQPSAMQLTKASLKLLKLDAEVVVPGELAGRGMKAVLAFATTGSRSDGKISVIPLEDAIRVRTGERGETAL